VIMNFGLQNSNSFVMLLIIGVIVVFRIGETNFRSICAFFVIIIMNRIKTLICIMLELLLLLLLC
jgi:hypothetical protein